MLSLVTPQYEKTVAAKQLNCPENACLTLERFGIQLVIRPMGQAVPEAGGASSRPARLRQCYSYLAFPESQFLLQPRKGFGLVDFQGSWVSYLRTCLGELRYKQNREFGMIILVWKKILVILMHSRCWRQNNLCLQFWRIWSMKSHLLFFSFCLNCGGRLLLF